MPCSIQPDTYAQEYCALNTNRLLTVQSAGMKCTSLQMITSLKI